MNHFLENEVLTKNYCVHLYSNINKETLSMKVDDTFLRLGYKVKVKELNRETIYQKGNRAVRLIAGGLSQYYKFSTVLEDDGDNMRLTLNSKSSGWSGGLIGVNKMKKEFKRIASFLEEI